MLYGPFPHRATAVEAELENARSQDRPEDCRCNNRARNCPFLVGRNGASVLIVGDRDSQTAKSVYPDTNVLLHFAVFDGFDWAALCGGAPVTIRVAQPVLSELNAIKDTGRTKAIRKRAQVVLRRLKSLLREQGEKAELGPGIKVILEARTVAVDTESGLNSNVSDDALISQILAFRKETKGEIFLVTDDAGVGLMVKATHWGITFIEPPESMRLPPEPDEDQKEREALRRRITQLEAASPALRLLFVGEASTSECKPPSFDIESAVAEKLEKLRKKYPVLPVPPPQPSIPDIGKMTLGQLATFHMDSLKPRPWGENPNLIKRYNEQLGVFYTKSEAVLRKNFETMARTQTIEMEVENYGGRPANDVRVTMHFPNGFKLLDLKHQNDCLVGMPNPPAHPAEASRPWDLNDIRIEVPSIPHFDIPDIAGPHLSIEETNSYKIKWTVRKLRQGDRAPVGPMFIVFNEAPFSFAITYEIVADNLPDIVHGKLSVILASE